jgi:hypothetical protein
MCVIGKEWSGVSQSGKMPGMLNGEFLCCFSHRDTGTQRMRCKFEVPLNPPSREPKVRCVSVPPCEDAADNFVSADRYTGF